MTPGNHRHIVFSMATSGLLLVGLFLFLNATSKVAHAAPGDLFVTPTSSGSACTQAQPCALQTALDQADDGQTIFAAEGTYTGTGEAVVAISNSIALYGGWDGSPSGSLVRDPDAYPSVLDGEGVRRIVYISGTITATLDGLVITHGNAAGLGGYNSYDAGGGVYINEAKAFISHCTISINSAGPASSAGNGLGGGIAVILSDAELESNLIISNTARWGGGVRVIFNSPVLRDNQIISNSSLFGGGMYLMGTRALVEDNLFQDNRGERGGGIYSSNAEATIAGNVIRDNQGSYGGGIGINAGFSSVVSGNLILNNVVDKDGGGISINYNNTRVNNNVIAHNEAPRSAGVSINQAATILNHNTIAHNSGGDGVGLFVGQDATMAVTNTMIVSHTVGISVTAGSTATLEGTLWGVDPWTNLSDWSGNGAVFTGAVNIWGDPDFLDPDGGDYHIGPNSAAINAGVDSAVTDDIDGDTRPQGSSYDIGADEFSQESQIFLPLMVRNYP